MAPNENARWAHEELFPGHVSTLAVTDPELTNEHVLEKIRFLDGVVRTGS